MPDLITPQTREVFGYLYRGNLPWAFASVKFEQLSAGYADGIIQAKYTVKATTNAEGRFSVVLWATADSESDNPILYRATLPDKTTYDLSIPVGTGAINFNVLIPGSLAPGMPGYSTLLTYIEEQLAELSEGAQGLSAYEVAVSNGFIGTESEWLASLQGEPGEPGTDGLDGANGIDGQDGANGLSAYELAQSLGFTGTLAEWLDSIRGEDGQDGLPGATGAQGLQGVPGIPGTNGTNGQDGINGADGADGLSAYQVAVANGFVGTEAQWLLSLRGERGEQGLQGLQGIQGVKGDKGDKGDTGDTGAQGTQGIQGLPGQDGEDGADGITPIITSPNGTITAITSGSDVQLSVAEQLARIVSLYGAAAIGNVIRKGSSGLEYASVSGGSSAPNQVSFSDEVKTITPAECVGSSLLVRQIGVLSASRVVNLPLANSVPVGYKITVADTTGSASWWYKIAVTPNAADNIAGAPNGLAFNLDEPRQSVTLVSDGANGWTILGVSASRRDLRVVKEDFTGLPAGSNGFAINTQNGGNFSSSALAADTGAIGVVSLLTNAQTAGRCSLHTPINSIAFGTATWRQFTRAWFSNIPSDGTDIYTAAIGFIGDLNGEPSNGIYFLIDTAISADLLAVGSAAGIRTRTPTGILASSLVGGWHEYGMEVNAAGTSVDFFVDGAKTTVPTNIPNTPVRTTGNVARITKAGGTNSRSMHIDWIYYSYQTNNPR